MYNKKLKKIQQEEFKMLQKFKLFAQKNNFQFMLFGGTLLGAIRHEGFIPWDDDIDLCMPKDDYDKLIKYAKKNPFIDTEKRFKIICPNDDNYFYPFIKIIDTKTTVYEKSIQSKFFIGLWIDIFPLDFWPNSLKEQKKIYRKNQFYRTMLKFSISGGNLTSKQKFLKMVALPFYYIISGNRKYQFWTNKVLSLAHFKDTNYVGNLVWALKQEDCFYKGWFSKTEEKDFCGEKFPVPVGWKEYLTQIYGDFMQLPPENKRQFHDFKVEYKK